MRLSPDRSWILPLLAAGIAVALAGCAGGLGWPALLTTLLWSAGLVLAGCGTSHDRDRPRVDAGDPGEDGGTWETCCNDGVIDTCYCPPMTACNYGWYDDCGDGMCSFDGCPGGDGGVDAGPTDAGTDAGGSWESCCVDGMIDTCFCPAGAACNYGWYTDCGDGMCAFGPDECTPDGGASDGGAADASPAFLDAGGA